MKKKRFITLLITLIMVLSTFMATMTSAGALTIPIITSIYPPAPRNLISNYMLNAIDFTWLAGADNGAATSGYKIERSDDDGATFKLIGTVNANTLKWSDQSSFKPHSLYRIYAYNINGKSAYSNICGIKSDDATLQYVEIETGALIPGPSDGAYKVTYKATTSNSSFKIKVKTIYPVYSLQIGTVFIPNGSWSENIPLQMGENKIPIHIRTFVNIQSDMLTVTRVEDDASGSTPSGGSAIDYSTASTWAVPELEQAQSYNVTTDKVMSDFQQLITREEFCGLVVKLYEALSGKAALPSLDNPFTDTTNGDALKAFNLGIIKGVTPNTFAPNNTITRQEICVMIYNAIVAAKPGLDTSTSGVAPFTDQSQISSWAINAVRFASKHGIMKGTGDNVIRPLDNTPREQAIILVKRTFESFTI